MYGTVNFAVYLIVLAACLHWLGGSQTRRRVLAPKTPAAAQAGAGLLLWAGLLLAVGGINVLVFHQFAPFQFTALPPGRMLNFLAFQLLVAVTEELLFRGCLTELGRGLRWHWLAIALASAALFAAPHYLTQHDAVQLVMAFVIGLVFSVVYQRCERCTVWSLALAHFLYDIAIINIA